MRFFIPMVLGLCGFGAEQVHDWRGGNDRREQDHRRPVAERCDVPVRRFDRDCAPERCEPRHDHSRFVRLDIDRGGHHARYDLSTWRGR